MSSYEFKARLVVSAEDAKNCEESDMAILAMSYQGHFRIHAPQTLGN
jgi:hypothetical protein